MKILHTVEYYYPSLGGAQELVRRLSERMVQLGHDVTVVTTMLPDRESSEHNGVKIVEFDIHGNNARGIIGDKQAYQDYLRHTKFDVVMNFAAQQWTADLFFEVIDEVSARKVFVPCGYSALYDPEYEDYFKQLPAVLRKYDATIYPSDDYRDINFARQHKIKNLILIPSAADELEFDEYDVLESEQIKARHGIGGLTLMTIGNHTGEKGHVETIKAFKYAPIGRATLVIAGGGKHHEGCWQYCNDQANRLNNDWRMFGKRIVLMEGSKREEVTAMLKAADIFMFLSNVECSPLVLFESVAARTPFIGTAAGNAAEIARWTSAGLIVSSLPRPNGRVQADTKDAVLKIMKLARNTDLRKIMADKGFRIWREKYTWEIITRQYLDSYKS